MSLVIKNLILEYAVLTRVGGVSVDVAREKFPEVTYVGVLLRHSYMQ